MNARILQWAVLGALAAALAWVVFWKQQRQKFLKYWPGVRHWASHRNTRLRH